VFLIRKETLPHKLNEVDADVHRFVENPLTESTGPNVRPEPPPDHVKLAQQKTPNRKSEQSDTERHPIANLSELARDS
jgi:hypothetical protein